MKNVENIVLPSEFWVYSMHLKCERLQYFCVSVIHSLQTGKTSLNCFLHTRLNVHFFNQQHISCEFHTAPLVRPYRILHYCPLPIRFRSDRSIM